MIGRRCMIFCVLAVLAPGCSFFEETGGGPTVTRVVANGAQKPLTSDASTATGHPKSQAAFNPSGRRDPFRSYLLDAAARRQAERRDRHIEETETFEISQYRLTAVLTGTSQPKAMVEDPTGRAFVVRIGARLGRLGGRITRIDSKGLQVVEETQTPTGTSQQAVTDLKLPNVDTDEPLPKPGVTP